MEDTKTTPDRREHSLWRAIFRWSVRILLLVMGLVLAALLWLGSESGLTQALSWAQQFLARNGQALAFDRLQGNLWRGIRFGRVEWRGFDTAVKGPDLVAARTAAWQGTGASAGGRDTGHPGAAR